MERLGEGRGDGREEARRGGGLVECLPGVSEGEEDGSTSAPPAEKLDRGSAFCFGEKKRKPPHHPPQ